MPEASWSTLKYLPGARRVSTTCSHSSKGAGCPTLRLFSCYGDPYEWEIVCKKLTREYCSFDRGLLTHSGTILVLICPILQAVVSYNFTYYLPTCNGQKTTCSSTEDRLSTWNNYMTELLQPTHEQFYHPVFPPISGAGSSRSRRRSTCCSRAVVAWRTWCSWWVRPAWWDAPRQGTWRCWAHQMGFS